jgi:hypothetical protein
MHTEMAKLYEISSLKLDVKDTVGACHMIRLYSIFLCTVYEYWAGIRVSVPWTCATMKTSVGHLEHGTFHLRKELS